MRRAQIVAVARSLVAEGGLEALTFGALEKRLAFTRGVVTYHFRDKEEIVEAVLVSAIAEIDAAAVAGFQSSASMETRVRAVLQALVDGFLDHREAGAILLSLWTRIPSDPRAAALNARLYENWRRQSARLVQHGREDGTFGDIPADAAGALMVSMVVGIVLQVIFEPGAVDPNALVEEAARTLLARLRAHGACPIEPSAVSDGCGSVRDAPWRA
jgi:AcrR family transcriptional regulator